MKSYKLTNISDKNVVFPEAIAHVVPYVLGNDEVIVSCTESDIAIINKLSAVGIIVSNTDSNLLGKAENDYMKYEAKISELESKIIEVISERDVLADKLKDEENKVKALEKKIIEKGESAMSPIKKASATVK